MCVSRFNPSNPCCDDAQECAACPSVNWDRYTYTVTADQTEIPGDFGEGDAPGGLQWYADYRFRELKNEPMFQNGACRWSLFGMLEGVTSWTQPVSFDDAKAEMLGAGTRHWTKGYDPNGFPSYWQPGWYYGQQPRGRAAHELITGYLEEYQQRIDDGEDLPPITETSILGNYQDLWGRGYFLSNLFAFSNGFEEQVDAGLFNWAWGWTFGFGGWYGSYPGGMSLGLNAGQWRIHVYGWHWNQFGSYASNDIFEPINHTDWNCVGENVFRIRPDIDQGTAPSTITIKARRIEPEVPYTYAWRLDEVPGNNIESKIHLYGVFT